MIKKIFLNSFLIALAGTVANAQALSDSELTLLPSIGGYFHYNINQHVSNFAQLPGIPNCCQNFQNGKFFRNSESKFAPR